MTPAVSAIARAVAPQFGSTVAAIRGRPKPRSATLARMVTLYVARAELGLSYPELGREVSRDHTTAIHAVSKIAALVLAEDPQILEAVEQGERAVHAFKAKQMAAKWIAAE